MTVRTPAKAERIALRVTPEQKQTIESAARATGRSVTDFAVHAAVASAEDAIADRRVFRVSDEQWESFVDTLTAPLPAANAERLMDTLNARSVFKQP